ncbi:MAG: hypothetical protein MK082_12165, partial [Phycisphaerales bacterium]|nr:hypothetical protein [Phycisphaerales bacterium]
MRIRTSNRIELVLLLEQMAVTAGEDNDLETREQKIRRGRKYARMVLDSDVWITEEEALDLQRIIYGELGPRCGAMVWIEKSHHGRPTDRVRLQHGFMTREDIFEHLDGVDRNMPCVNSIQLNVLLKRDLDHWADLMVVSMK